MRRGVSLLEVLFAVMVIAIGVLGAVGLMTVAGSQARKGRVFDQVAVLGPRAAAEFETRAWIDHTAWLERNTTTNTWQPVPVSAMEYGDCFCIDPRFVAANFATPAARFFPADVPTGTQVRMRRLTLNSGLGPLVPMSKVLSDDLFFFADDLTSTRSEEDRSLQPEQSYDTLPTDPLVKTRRQSDGEFSWMATLVPTFDTYTPSNVGFSTKFVLSIVIFDQRSAGMELANEQLCGITFPGGGVQGGEVLLTSPSTIKVRSGDWLLVMGSRVHPDLILEPVPPGQAQPITPKRIPVCQWYRVSDTEAEDTPSGGGFERYVSLMGRDWDTALANPQAVLVDGVVGVYEKTVNLR